MKIKFNWGTAMAVVMVLFMIFILQYFYRAVVYDKYNHHLVSDDYYKEELNYQHEIDKENKANHLKQNIALVTTNEGLEIVFPSQFDFAKLKGTIKLQRPSNYKLDIKKSIKLTSNTLLIPKKELVKGMYDVAIDWTYNKDAYLYKRAIYY
jgi:hypothetical protein